jgi:predicted dehydrogenase
MSLNVCILGCGELGLQHVAAWQACRDASVVAVYNRSEERRARAAEMAGAVPYDSYEAAVLHEGVDIVSVCVPNCLHAELTCFAARHGRHVLCEKPIALTLPQADEMIDTARENGVTLAVAFKRRGITRCMRAREMVTSGAFGGPVFMRFNDVREVRPKLAMHQPNVNGGPVIDMACHLFDAMRFITGREPVEVLARGHVFGRGKPRLACLGEDLAIDAANIDVGFEAGNHLSMLLCWGMPEGYPETSEELIAGPEVTLRHTQRERRFEVQCADQLEQCDDSGDDCEATVNTLADAVLGRRESPLATGEDGREALRVSLAALESIRSGELVRLR